MSVFVDYLDQLADLSALEESIGESKDSLLDLLKRRGVMVLGGMLRKVSTGDVMQWLHGIDDVRRVVEGPMFRESIDRRVALLRVTPFLAVDDCPICMENLSATLEPIYSPIHMLFYRHFTYDPESIMLCGICGCPFASDVPFRFSDKDIDMSFRIGTSCAIPLVRTDELQEIQNVLATYTDNKPPYGISKAGSLIVSKAALQKDWRFANGDY